MMKKNKIKLIISSLLILMPFILGFFGDKLSDRWGSAGYMNYSAVFIIFPLILLLFHWLCLFITYVFNKNNGQSPKVLSMTYWIFPCISIAVCATIFATAIEKTSFVFPTILVLIALAFIIIGNYMPKTTRNVAVGIKTRWSLSSDENWNATHRFGGRVFVAAGFLSLIAIPLPIDAFPFVLIFLALICAILPTVYSYRFYRKQLADGSITCEDCKNAVEGIVKNKKLARIITVAGIAAAAILVCIIMFTGGVKTVFSEDSFTVEASYWSDLTLNYSDVDSVEYREDGISAGMRVAGISSARVLIGNFKNDELGNYLRYTYIGDNPCILIKTESLAVVLGASTEEELKDIYVRILAEISE